MILLDSFYLNGGLDLCRTHLLRIIQMGGVGSYDSPAHPEAFDAAVGKQVTTTILGYLHQPTKFPSNFHPILVGWKCMEMVEDITCLMGWYRACGTSKGKLFKTTT